MKKPIGSSGSRFAAFCLALLAVLTALCLTALPVLADDFDIDYSGKTDDTTGDPIGGGVELGEEPVLVSGNEYYDPVEKRFVFVLPTSGLRISSNVADGMVVTGNVSIKVPGGANASLYRDGKPVAQTEFGQLSTPGKYVLNVAAGGNTEQPLSFTIVKGTTGALNEYRVPAGFAVTEWLLDGREQEITVRSVDMSAEGRYDITYYCQATAIGYSLNVTVDHTPPKLALNAVKDGIAKSAVDLSDLPRGCSIYIEHDGKAMDYQKKLTEGGGYVVTVTDEAGNSTTYKFMIQVYLNSWGTVLCVAAVALVAGVGVYLIHSRRHLKIR